MAARRFRVDPPWLLVLALLLTGQPALSATAPALMSVRLTEGASTIELRADGSCRRGDRAGSLPRERFERHWDTLTHELDLASLETSDVRASVRRQIQATGMVVAEDGARVSRLDLDVAGQARQVVVNGLALLREAYPDARHLARFAAARLVMKEAELDCTIEP